MTLSGPGASLSGAGRSGLVDDFHLLVVPIVRGGGIQVLPSNVRVKRDLLDERPAIRSGIGEPGR
jgi:hypothetical protein